MENQAEGGEKSSSPRAKPRISMFSVLNGAADRSYSRNTEDQMAYQKLVHAEMSEWNKVMKEVTKDYGLTKKTVGLDVEGIRKKVASFALNPEVFLAEQEQFVTIVKEFVKECNEFHERTSLINEASQYLMDEVTIRQLEEMKYQSH